MGPEKGGKGNDRINYICCKELMNVHRLAASNISDREFKEQRKLLELWITVIYWLPLLHQNVKVLKEIFLNGLKYYRDWALEMGFTERNRKFKTIIYLRVNIKEIY